MLGLTSCELSFNDSCAASIFSLDTCVKNVMMMMTVVMITGGADDYGCSVDDGGDDDRW